MTATLAQSSGIENRSSGSANESLDSSDLKRFVIRMLEAGLK
jgi:hypothetical protein